jgi:hypothetical protein
MTNPSSQPALAMELPPPRPLTPVARRRSWAEPRVRFWLIAAGVFLIAAAVLGYEQYRDWAYDAWLVNHGTLVEASILSVDGVERAGYQVPPPANVEIQFDLDGQTRQVTGRIEPTDGFTFVSPHLPIRIRVDPKTPQRWTARVQGDPLVRQFVGAGILLAMAVVAGCIAVLGRRRALNAWRHGAPIDGVVASVGRSAMAPRSWCVRWRVRGGADKRLFIAYVPQRLAAIQTGDPLVLLGDPRRPRRAVVAGEYQ